MEASCGQRERRPIDAGSSLGPDAAPKGCIGMASQTVDQDVDIGINVDGDVDVDIDVGFTALTPPLLSCQTAEARFKRALINRLVSQQHTRMHVHSVHHHKGRGRDAQQAIILKSHETFPSGYRVR